MDMDTYNNSQMTIAALQQLQNTVTSIADMKNSHEQTQIAKDNLDFNKSVSEQNFTMQNNQFEYQKQLNDKIMQREDNAMQRQVADLQKAGLSPLMVSNGASATPLTSASAPQRDTTQINQAMNNMFSAYNDYYTRKLNRQNFALQNRVQTAQAYSQLAESKLNMEKSKIEKSILETDLKYYQNHPERNLGIQQVLMNLAAKYLENNFSTPGDTINLPDVKNALNNALESSSNIGKSYNKYPNVKQIKKDQGKLLSESERKYNQFATSIENVKDINSESFNNAVDYFWNYYAKYDKAFNSYESFKSKLVNDKEYRSKIRSNFKYKAPFSPW